MSALMGHIRRDDGTVWEVIILPNDVLLRRISWWRYAIFRVRRRLSF